MPERNFDRGLDMFNPNLFRDKKIWIIWAWGIGSNSAYVLSKMWLKVKVCDFDEVDIVNTSGQFYSMEQLWKPKVEMLKQNIKIEFIEEEATDLKKYINIIFFQFCIDC